MTDGDAPKVGSKAISFLESAWDINKIGVYVQDMYRICMDCTCSVVVNRGNRGLQCSGGAKHELGSLGCETRQRVASPPFPRELSKMTIPGFLRHISLVLGYFLPTPV